MSSSPRSQSRSKSSVGGKKVSSSTSGKDRRTERSTSNVSSGSKGSKSGRPDNPPGIIKTPRKDDDPSRRQGSGKTEKGILKNKKGERSKNGKGKQPKESKEKKKPKPRVRQKTLVQKIASNFGVYVGEVKLHDSYAIEAAQALDLQPWHLRRLKMKFDKIDIDNSGNIDYDEFFESIGELRSPFTDKLFALIDLDGSGTIEFDEYVRVMATYCMFTKDEILRFCFECFDVDRSGTIDEKEFVELCKCVNNASPSFPNNFRKALEEFDVNEDGLIDYSEFQAIDSRYPLVLFPAFRLQDLMQRNSLGESGWRKVMEKYQAVKALEEYKATHGGRAPPDPPLKAAAKAVFPCLFREKVHIKVGFDMEDRHRSGKES